MVYLFLFGQLPTDSIGDTLLCADVFIGILRLSSAPKAAHCRKRRPPAVRRLIGGHRTACASAIWAGRHRAG